MAWTATSKVRRCALHARRHARVESLTPYAVRATQEVVSSNFFKELRHTWNQYRSMYCLFTFFAVMIVRPPVLLVMW